MFKRHMMILIFIGVLACLLAASTSATAKPRPRFAPDLIKVKLSAQALTRAQLPMGLYAQTHSFNLNELDQLLSRNGGTSVIRAHRQVKDKKWQAETGFDRWFLIKLDGSTSVEEAIKSFQANRYIEAAIPEYYAYTTAIPNDTYYANNWGHNNTAQLPVYTGGSHSGAGVGTIGYDADMQLAWDQSQGYGSSSVIIALIDSGVDTAHPDLRLMAGFDYGDNDNNPMDDSAEPGHGTACSGIAAGRANNGLGVTGVAGGCSVMPLKIASSDGSLGFTAIENALTHTGDNNVDVASMSFGAEGGMVEGDSPSTDTALEYAYSHGVTLLAATANSNTSAIAYPSNHNKVISVGASSPTGQRKSTTSSDGENWWGSNYGTAVQDASLAVDIMAPTILPATDITGTGNGYNTSSDYYMWFNGTSCATPYAAGVAALLISKDPTLTPAQVRQAMVSTCTDMTVDGGAGWDRYTGYGMVNANAALNSLVPGMPSCTITAPLNGTVIDLNSTVTVNVTATDTDGTISNVKFYIDDVLKNTDSASPYSWSWNTTGYNAGSHTIKAVATDNSSNTATNTMTVNLLAPANEGFETGNFSAQPWTNNSAIPWTIQNSEKYSGNYAAKSGAIGNSASSELSLTLNLSSSGNISFFQRVSSESGYDYLRFYLDNVQQGEWSGSGVWTQQSYAVSSGLHTFKWVYSKDGSETAGSDCAWIDHLNFPTPAAYYPPPQNLSAAGGNQTVVLTWSAPAGGTPTGYKIFKNGSLLTTVSGTSYNDNAVVNGTSYSYYLKAVYSGGESEATATVNATPNIITSVVIGSGTSSTATTGASPINVYYQSLHGQAVYTAAELTAAGLTGPIDITQLGINITGLPTLAMPNFVVRMKHTTATNVASWVDNTSLVTVYSNSSYQPIATGWNMLTLSTPFVWNGTDNILIDTAYGLIGSYNASGTVQYTTLTNGYRYGRSDTVDQTSVFTGGSTATTRPNLRLVVAPIVEEPEIVVNQTSLNFGPALVGTSPSLSFTISNSGGSTLTGTIDSGSSFFTVSSAAKQMPLSEIKNTRNSLPYSIASGQSAVFNVVFAPAQEQAYYSTLTIGHNAEGAAKTISLSGSGYLPLSVPFAEGFEDGWNNWIPVNGTQTNYWIVGSAVSETGTGSLYISNNGTDNNYTLTSSSIVHAYRDIAIPAGTDTYYLKFAWKAQGEGTTTPYDYLQAYLIETGSNPIAGTELSSGELSAELRLVENWQLFSYALPLAANGTSKRLVFSWKNDSSLGTQAPAAIDNIRIVKGSQSDAAIVIDNNVVITPPPVTDPDSQVINPSIQISGLTNPQDFITVTTGYASLDSPYENTGMDFIFMGTDFAGATLNITHNLGYAPNQLAYRVGDSGSWSVFGNPGSWTGSNASFTVPAAKGENDVYLIFANSEEGTLPVTLSSFTAVLNNTNNVSLQWVTASETGLLGFYMYRSESEVLEDAGLVSALIAGTNTSNEQHYLFTDYETEAGLTYNYWLQSMDLDGGVAWYGPVVVSTLGDGANPEPIVPKITQLIGNYPNPFNPQTTLRYSLDKSGKADFTIWNSKGQIVWKANREHNAPGFYTLAFEGRDIHGQSLSSGVYFCRMNFGKDSYIHKMILLK